jgi:hypothetical protein
MPGGTVPSPPPLSTPSPVLASTPAPAIAPDGPDAAAAGAGRQSHSAAAAAAVDAAEGSGSATRRHAMLLCLSGRRCCACACADMFEAVLGHGHCAVVCPTTPADAVRAIAHHRPSTLAVAVHCGAPAVGVSSSSPLPLLLLLLQLLLQLSQLLLQLLPVAIRRVTTCGVWPCRNTRPSRGGSVGEGRRCRHVRGGGVHSPCSIRYSCWIIAAVGRRWRDRCCHESKCRCWQQCGYWQRHARRGTDDQRWRLEEWHQQCQWQRWRQW